MKTIKQTYYINSSLEKVWDALVNQKTIEKWSGGPAVMNDAEGSKFKLWGDEIHGTNLKVAPMKKLVQEWYSSDSPGHLTTVTFTLAKENDGTRVELLHENVPDDKADDIADGWNSYYLGEIKKYLEKKSPV